MVKKGPLLARGLLTILEDPTKKTEPDFKTCRHTAIDCEDPNCRYPASDSDQFDCRFRTVALVCSAGWRCPGQRAA